MSKVSKRLKLLLAYALASASARRAAVVVFALVFSALLIQQMLFVSKHKQLLLSNVEASVASNSLFKSAASLESELEGLLTALPGTSQYSLSGYAVAYKDGAISKHGDTYHIEKLFEDPKRRPFIDHHSLTYDVPGTALIGESNEPASLVYRFDIRSLSHTHKQQIVRAIASALLLGVIAGLVALCWFAHFFVKPLNGLIQSVKKIGPGNVPSSRESLAPESSVNEITRLTSTLDDCFTCFDLALLSERESSDTFRQLAGLESRGLWEIDSRSCIKRLDSKGEAILGTQLKAWQGRKLTDVVTAINMNRQTQAQLSGPAASTVLNDCSDAGSDQSVAKQFVDIKRALQTCGSWEGELQALTDAEQASDAEPRMLSIQAAAKRDSAGKYIGAIGTIEDITHASRLARDLKHQARHDALTGLANRLSFDEHLDKAIAQHRSCNTACCVCMLDLDKFKQVNDNCGHAAGDLLLTQVSQSILDCVRSTDLVSRFGGDEFTLILNNCSVEQALVVCEKIHKAIEAYRFSWDGREFVVGASIGVAGLSSDLELASDVLLAADASCYRAKKSGRNQTQVYNHTDPGVVEHYGEMQWISRITDALEEDSFELYYQPIVAAVQTDDGAFHSEVLVRMRDRESRSYLPAEFLGAAQRYCLMPKIDKWVVEHMLAWLQQQGTPRADDFCFAVNLSNLSIGDETFRHFLLQSIKDSSLDASCLRFEFAEEGLIRAIDSNIDFYEVWLISDASWPLTILEMVSHRSR